MACYCNNCRFRLMINTHDFHCAALYGPKGWAYYFDLRVEWRLPQDCDKFIQGAALIVGHELKHDEFAKVAGKRIRVQDWRKWKEEL